MYEVKLFDGLKKGYIQYIGKDVSNLGGHVIRIFKDHFDADERIDLSQLYCSSDYFYAQTFVNPGVDAGLWQKQSVIPLEDDFKLPWFKHTPDIDHNSSFRWSIYKLYERPIFVGILFWKLKKLADSDIRNPFSIISILEESIDD